MEDRRMSKELREAEASQADRNVDDLAGQALRIVASRGRLSAPERRAGNIDALLDAATHGDRATCKAVLDRLLDGGVPREVVADDYIPAIARRMGDAWCTDEMSFAAVTIGVSRLQSLLRDLGPEWRADSVKDANASATLIVVALDEYHTLGAMILAGRLRRSGLSVQLQIGVQPAELRRHLDVPRYDAVLISASIGESLENLRLLVEAVRNSASGDRPVVIGGSVTECGEDVMARTGANCVTSDPGEALAHCGLKIPIQLDTPPRPEA